MLAGRLSERGARHCDLFPTQGRGFFLVVGNSRLGEVARATFPGGRGVRSLLEVQSICKIERVSCCQSGEWSARPCSSKLRLSVRATCLSDAWWCRAAENGVQPSTTHRVSSSYGQGDHGAGVLESREETKFADRCAVSQAVSQRRPEGPAQPLLVAGKFDLVSILAVFLAV